MTENVFNIIDPFRKGLRPEDNFLTQEGYLESCYNLIPTPAGLEEERDISDPFSGGVTVNPPFPQVFRGRDLTLMFSATTLNEVSTAAIPWTLSGVSLVSTNGNTGAAIPTGGPWHFVDLGPTFYAFNGACSVFRPGFSILTDSSTVTYVETNVKPKTACEHKGRVFIGGLDKSSVWNSDWDDIFAEWEAAAKEQQLDFEKDGPGANWVMWSSIGGGDFPLWLFYPEGKAQLNIGPTKQEVIQRIKRNEFGWAPLRMNGTVQVLKPLGDTVIAYGDEGIEALTLSGKWVGFRRVARFGVLGRGAVGGDEKRHVFLDQEGNLWTLSENLELERLGYEEYLSGMDGDKTLVTYEPLDDQYYISDNVESFVLTQSGLGETKRKVTSFVPIGNTVYSLFTNAATTDVIATTGAHENRREALKQLHDIQVHYQGIRNLKVTILYRYDHNSTYSSLGPITVNPQGVVYPTLTCRDYKIKLSGTAATLPRIFGLEVRWNLVDKRAVRGVY